ncbi:MAG: ABC transporter permease subunit [Pirellula sp.]
MPILDLGYRPWNGTRTAEWLRWSVVARTGISLVWRGTWLKRILLFATIPALIAMFGIGLFEQGTRDEQYRRAFNQFMSGRNRPFEVRGGRGREQRARRELIVDAQNQRHLAWSNVLLWYFRYPQALWLVVVVGLVAPRLISYDLRSRGYLMYLSRPLSPAGYVLGKACVLFFLLAMITTVPALTIYGAGILLSNDYMSIAETWDLPFRILLSTAVLVLPTSAVALAFSSMTQESRFAAFAWFAVWIVGWVTYLVLTGSAMLNEQDILELQERWLLISPYHTLGHLQQEIFGLVADGQHRVGPWIVCIGVTLVGFGVAHWRVSRTLKV